MRTTMDAMLRSVVYKLNASATVYEHAKHNQTFCTASKPTTSAPPPFSKRCPCHITKTCLLFSNPCSQPQPPPILPLCLPLFPGKLICPWLVLYPLMVQMALAALHYTHP